MGIPRRLFFVSSSAGRSSVQPANPFTNPDSTRRPSAQPTRPNPFFDFRNDAETAKRSQ